MPVVGNYTLFDLTLPGSHDSLAYDLCPELDPAQPAWLNWLASLEAAPPLTQTQTLGIAEQLDHGIRFLDLRVMLMPDGVWRGVHFLCTCEPASGYLFTIRNWLERHPTELLVVWLSEHGEADYTGEDQYPGVSIEAKISFWHEILGIFEDIAVPATAVNQSISELVAANKRLVFVVSDWEEFSDSSPLAIDARDFLYNDISRDLDLSLSLPLMEKSIARGAARRAALAGRNRFWLMSLAPALDLVHMRGAIHSMYLKTKLFGDTPAARQCAEAIGVPNMTWCPDALMEFSRLFNYYAQALIERGVAGGEEADLPHAFYVDALGEGGVVKTDRRSRSERGYAIVDKILMRNVNRLCEVQYSEITCKSIIAELTRRAQKVGPFRLWEDPKHGRVMGWPGVGANVTL